MKTNSKFSAMIVAVVLSLLLASSHSVFAQSKPKPWPVPEADKGKKAAVKLSDASVIASGKELWMKHCKSCHGSKGLGDGAKAATLKTETGDFSTADFQKQTDGELFYKTSKGRDEMPNYEKKVPDAADRWALVAFMRTMKK